VANSPNLELTPNSDSSVEYLFNSNLLKIKPQDRLIEERFFGKSYLTTQKETKFYKFYKTRLLTVDHRLILPSRVHIRFLVTSNDVLHS